MKVFLADKPVKAAPFLRSESTGYEGSRIHCLYVQGDNGEEALPLHDGPLHGDGPETGDMVIDHGSFVSWMSAHDFSEAYEEVQP